MTPAWGIYARVSSKRQVEDGLSIEAQLTTLREYAIQRGYAVREFVDAGKSAWRDDLNQRPAFKELLDAARAGEIAGVIVTHLDRFSRNLIITLSTLGELGKLGVGFISLENSAFDFSRPADRLLMAVLGAFAQYYSDELSRKIKRGLETRAGKGLRNGLLPFGYCNGKCVDCKRASPQCAQWNNLPNDAPVILHPTDAPGVALAFETYRQRNRSYDDIADVLNAAGYRSRTPGGRVLWNKHSVCEMLRNITYTGIVIHKGKEIAGQHPAIISRELFDEVAAIRRARKNRQKTFNRAYRVYLFGGVLRCASCGRVLRSVTRKKNERASYHCTSKELRHTECRAKRLWVYEDQIAGQFARIIAQCQLPADWQSRITEIINGNGAPRARKPENERAAVLERLARLKKQFEWGDLEESDYLAKRDELKRALAVCETPAVRGFVDAARYLQTMAMAWDSATNAERRDMVRAMFDAVDCDLDARRIVALRPKPAFHFLFRRVPELTEHAGTFDIHIERE